MYTRNRQPGKFEGNTSELRAKVLYDCVMNGAHESEFGESEFGGWHGLIVGKRFAFIVQENAYGFFDIDSFCSVYGWGKLEEVRERFAKMEESYLEEYSDNDYC